MPKDAPLILQGGGSKRGESWCPKTRQFTLLASSNKTATATPLKDITNVKKSKRETKAIGLKIYGDTCDMFQSLTGPDLQETLIIIPTLKL